MFFGQTTAPCFAKNTMRQQGGEQHAWPLSKPHQTNPLTAHDGASSRWCSARASLLMSGGIGELPYRILVSVGSVFIAMLSLSGVVIWWVKRKSRWRQNRLQKQNTTRKQSKLGAVETAAAPPANLVLNVSRVLTRKEPACESLLKLQGSPRSWQPPPPQPGQTLRALLI
jgi:hypothetical protein